MTPSNEMPLEVYLQMNTGYNCVEQVADEYINSPQVVKYLRTALSTTSMEDELAEALEAVKNDIWHDELTKPTNDLINDVLDKYRKLK